MLKSKKESTQGYRDLLTQPEYLKLAASNWINRFGDSVDSIAFAWLVYAITESAAWSAVILAFNQLPTILLQPLTGVLADRFRKKRLMVAADLCRALLVVGFLLLYLGDWLTPWRMAAFTMAVSTVEAFRVPAGSALVPKVLERRLYDFGVGLNSTVSKAMELLGVAAGGVLIGVLGIWIVILLDAAAYFLSALILMGIRCQEEPKKNGKLNLKEYGKELKEGFVFVKSRKIVFNFCILAFLVNALLVPVNAFEAALVSSLGMGAELMSILNLVMLAGMGMSSFVYPYLRRKCRVGRLVMGSGVLLGAAYLALAWGEGAAVPVAAGGIMGCAVGLLGAALGTEFLKAVEPEYLARCSGVCNSGASAAMPLASGFCSFLAVFCPIRVIFVASSVFIVLLFICMALAGMQFDAPEDA